MTANPEQKIGEETAPQARPNWTRIHLIYVLLAACDLAAIGLGLWLSEHTKTQFQDSMVSVDGADLLHDHEVNIQQRIAGIATPAYDLLSHRDAAKARSDLKTGMAAFDEAAGEDGFVGELKRRFPPGTAIPDHDEPDAIPAYAGLLGVPVPLMQRYEQIEEVMRDLAAGVAASQAAAIDSFVHGDLTVMAAKLGESRSSERKLQVAVAELGSLADDHTAAIVRDSKATFTLATRLQYVIGGFILAMVAIVLSYGHVVGKLLRRKYDELAAANRQERELSGTLAGLNQDITALNVQLAANVKQLTEAQEEIIRRGRMAQLGQLTATVAHELRNPLGSVRTSAYLLERRIKDKGLGVEPQLQRIANGITRCDNIISQLLEFSRSRALQPEPVKLDDWLVGLIEEEAAKLPPEVAVECNLGLGDETVVVDSGLLSRALINLLSNAAEAVCGRTDAAERTQRITISTRLSQRGVEIAVADTGPGIRPELLDKIREPLFTTKSFGTGLGLPVTDQIVGRHGGALDVASVPGEGAVFTIVLPHEATVPAAEAPAFREAV